VSAPVEPLRERVRRYFVSIWRYFTEQDPTFTVALPPAIVVAVILFVRSPLSNYIFDEQEALLANPYVNGKFGVLEAFKRDFWGLLPDRSIGSYRPLPNLIWKGLFFVSDRPFVHHLVNILGHAVNASLVASLAFALSRKRELGWLSGAAFLCFAVLTEAVTGVVGIADVLGGLGVLLALASLRLRWLAPLGVLAGMTIGLFSKESAIVGVPLVAYAGLVLAPSLHPARPLRLWYTASALVAAVVALVGYTYLRRKLFPINLPAELATPLPLHEPAYRRALHAFLAWFQQPSLPQDPINNPLVDADLPHRIAGALRVYFRGLGQVLFPVSLSGDYSFPEEPVPDKLVFPESVLGGIALLLSPIAGAILLVVSWVRERRERLSGTFASAPSSRHTAYALLALGLVWIPIAYFPHSNIPVLLPTVRAERFWYLPCVGAALMFGVVFDRLLASGRRFASYAVIGWFAWQAGMARWHAIDYTDDLIFWNATRKSVPRSAKAQLNYSVMVGARGKLEERLAANRRALELAPEWPMAHVYLGDTLCRMHRAAEAWPHYARGFELGPNDPNLIALGLQCLWDEKAIAPHQDELTEMAERHPGSWLAFLGNDIVANGEQHQGVQKQYRPRGYDEGPKNE
jgi:tetratricopeptide (TPR) repeat protein